MNTKYWLLAVFIILIASTAGAASVGTAPGFIDLNSVEQGETIEKELYITTNFDREFVLAPEVTAASQTVMFRDSVEERFETSEKRINEWVQIEEEVIINPNSTSIVDLDQGGSARAAGSVEMVIDVPESAEPGYHYGNVNLNPEIRTEEEGAGTINWGETSPNFRLRVPGNAERQIEVLDVRGFRTGEERASVEVLLSNRGTVTTSVEDFEIDILDSQGEVVNKLQIRGTRLSPGETEWRSTRWLGDMQEGSYEVDGEANFITGETYVSGSFSLSDIVEVVPDDSPESETVETQGSNIPIWLVIMVLVVLGVLMWSFEIDPVWILGIVGVLGISAFILMSNVSNLLLVGVLIPALLIVYLGV